MSESSKIASNDAENNYQRHCKTCKDSYVVVIGDSEGHIADTPFASFDRGLCEEVALEYAYELMWREWYWKVHSPKSTMDCGWVSAVYQSELTDYYIRVRRIPWYG